VVLVSTRNPLNIGAAARAMSNFGFAHLRVVNPWEAAFREARSAVGAAPVLSAAQEFQTLAEAVADCALVVGATSVGRRTLEQPVRTLAAGARLIRRRLSSGRVALLFGSEKVGLSNRDLSHCDWLIRIPTRIEHRSMNLGQAVAVCLYEVARDYGKTPPAEKVQPATASDRERITSLLADVLRSSGFLKAWPPALADEKLRRLVRRLRLSSSDAEVWLGILRQVLWKLRSSNSGPS